MKGLEVLQKLNSGKFMRMEDWEEGMYIELVEGILLFKSGRQASVEVSDLYHYNWEQYIEKYNVGDWVINLQSGKIHKIEADIDHGQYRTNLQAVLHEQNLRRATLEEVKAEEERLQKLERLKEEKRWHDLGRNVNEYRAGDIVYKSNIGMGIVYWEKDGKTCYYILNDRRESTYISETSEINLVCTVENRTDIQ